MTHYAQLFVRFDLVTSSVPVTESAITLVGILAIVVLIGLSAFFASSEIAIFSLEDHRLSSLIADEKKGATTLATLKSNPRRLLVTILVGNNIANIGMSSIATGLLGLYFTGGEAVLIATFGITSVVLLFGESAPKSYAVEHSESWALRIARPLRLSQYVMYPLVVVFDILTNAINRLMGSEGTVETVYVTRSEIREVIDVGEREGVLDEAEHLMLQRLLRFRNRTAKETMVPRLDIVAVDRDADPSTAVELCIESGHRQLPVYDETLDAVVGIVDAVDLLALQERGNAGSIRAAVSEPYLVPESKDVDELLTELRAERRRMAIVVDEYGITAGIVTVEDIVEEIIGEVLTQTETTPIRWVDETTAIVRGEVNVHELNEQLRGKIPETGEFESIAGFIFERAGRVVQEGETIVEDDVRLTVETVERNRILEVRVTVPA